MRVLTSKIGVLWAPPAQDHFICNRNKIGVAGEGKPGTEVEGGLEGVMGTAKAWGTLRFHLVEVMGNVEGQEYRNGMWWKRRMRRSGSVGKQALEPQLLVTQPSGLWALFAACRRSASQERELGRKLILLKHLADAPSSHLLDQTMAWVQRSGCLIGCRLSLGAPPSASP